MGPLSRWAVVTLRKRVHPRSHFKDGGDHRTTAPCDLSEGVPLSCFRVEGGEEKGSGGGSRQHAPPLPKGERLAR